MYILYSFYFLKYVVTKCFYWRFFNAVRSLHLIRVDWCLNFMVLLEDYGIEGLVVSPEVQSPKSKQIQNDS